LNAKQAFSEPPEGCFAQQHRARRQQVGRLKNAASREVHLVPGAASYLFAYDGTVPVADRTEHS